MKHSTFLLLSTCHILNNADNKKKNQVFHYTDNVQTTKQIDETRASCGGRAAAVAQTSLSYPSEVLHTV